MPVMTSHADGSEGRLEAGRQRMIGYLRSINVVLARTPMAGRYWLFGGVLLGYVREHNVLLHDSSDADFAFLAEDLERLEACIPALVDAGFQPLYRFPGVEGDACGHRDWGAPLGHVYNVYEIPAQPLEEIRFLERTWLKPRNPDLQLTAMY